MNLTTEEKEKEKRNIEYKNKYRFLARMKNCINRTHKEITNKLSETEIKEKLVEIKNYENLIRQFKTDKDFREQINKNYEIEDKQ